jgi:hypothetical protein
MAIANHIARWGGARMSTRLSRSMPWVGAAIALVTIAGTMKRKGFLRGGLDTALNATPIVGAMKNLAEVARGRDFIPDRPISSLPRRA